MGLSREVSTRLSEQTVLGAAKLVRETMLHPAILRDQVITPGGVTISAIHELEKHGLVLYWAQPGRVKFPVKRHAQAGEIRLQLKL